MWGIQGYSYHVLGLLHSPTGSILVSSVSDKVTSECMRYPWEISTLKAYLYSPQACIYFPLSHDMPVFPTGLNIPPSHYHRNLKSMSTTEI